MESDDARDTVAALVMTGLVLPLLFALAAVLFYYFPGAEVVNGNFIDFV